MKKKIRTISFLAILAMAATSCQKDNNPLYSEENLQTYTQLHYTSAGQSNTVFLSSDKDWSLFLDKMIALAREGYTVEIMGNPKVNVKYKEIITFTTTSAEEVKAWTNNMLLQGYDVTVDYNEATGVFTCVARR